MIKACLMSVGNRWALWWMGSRISYSPYYRRDEIWVTSFGKVKSKLFLCSELYLILEILWFCLLVFSFFFYLFIFSRSLFLHFLQPKENSSNHYFTLSSSLHFSLPSHHEFVLLMLPVFLLIMLASSCLHFFLTLYLITLEATSW